MQGITPLSPVLSWARQADRLAFVYYEKGKFDVYSITNPRELKRQPYKQGLGDSVGVLARATTRPSTPRDRCRCERTSARRSAKAARSTGPRRDSVRPAIWRSGTDTTRLAAAGLHRGACSTRPT